MKICTIFELTHIDRPSVYTASVDSLDRIFRSTSELGKIRVVSRSLNRLDITPESSLERAFNLSKLTLLLHR